jgi:membrane-bound serine protease (ClpP class)
VVAVIRALALALILLGFGGAIASHSIGMARAQGDHAAVIEIDGIIQPTSARFLARAIDTAGEQNAEVLIVLLDTPGGLLDSTRKTCETAASAAVQLPSAIGRVVR